MSDSNGPTRRRRIAGEAAPAVPSTKAAKKTAAKKAAVAKPSAKKPAAKKSAVAKAPAAAVAAPAAKKSPVTKKAPAAKKAPALKKPVVTATPAPVAASVSAPSVATRKTSAVKGETTVVAPDRPAGSRPSRRDLIWLVPSTLVAVAALVMGVFFLVSPPGASDSGAELATSQRQASSAAASAAETIFTFRYDELDQHLAASKALMTPAFGKEFDTIAPALTELAPQRQIQVQAQARESAALPCGDECSTSKADVLVFVDQARLVGDSTEPTVFANRIKVSMVKSDDGWLVSNIRAL